MQARNSLKVKVLEPLTRYKIDYDKDGFVLDLEWEAIGPMHELQTGDAGQPATAKFHIEQPGRMKGTIRRHGEEFSVDCFSMRDTSYGARDYESLAFGGYFWGIAAGSSFHALCMNTPGTGGREAELHRRLHHEGRRDVQPGLGQAHVSITASSALRTCVFEGTDKLGRRCARRGSSIQA